jgi:hypothetical protein
MKVPDLEVGKRLFVGEGIPEILGRGPTEIRGSSYIESPTIIGNPNVFPNIWATCMIGPLTNPESPPPFVPGALAACGIINNSPYSLAVIGDAVVLDNLDVNLTINAGGIVRAGALVQSQGDVVAFCGVHRLSAKKDFDIPHPTKEGWRLTHACMEGPEAAVYVRGRLTNSTEINLPSYWKKLVDIQSITVSLTPIGAHQDIIIKRWDDEKVYLQSKGGMPIDCFYHIYAERIDTEKLIPEYKGSIEDYPGDNSQRSIVGYHYDVKETIND